MNALKVPPLDTLYVKLVGVTHPHGGPVTSGLIGTVTIVDAAGATAAGPVDLVNAGNNDWDAFLAAPATTGDYILRAAFDADGAHRTIAGALFVRTEP